MNKKYQLSLHIFRRDLRLEDNTALISALEQSAAVVPCFIFDPKQIKNNPYKSDASIQFMIESLEDLQQQLKSKSGKLFLFYGNPVMALKEIAKNLKFEAIFVNRDYTPFSIERDKGIRLFCSKNNIDFFEEDDLLLQPPGTIIKKDLKPYTVFTPFYKKSLHYKVKQPKKNSHNNYYRGRNIKNTILLQNLALYDKNPKIVAHGGRKKCLLQIKNFIKNNHYETRDFPALNSTSKLSPHLKFSTCSVREIYYLIKNNINNSDSFIRELYWRDFFTQIAYFFPFVFGHSFHKKYNNLRWNHNTDWFKKWCEGNTGFPIIDAGMRQLNQTGYMHNRVRLITASFLVKDLQIDWRHGEKYFASKLVDYDPAVNNGNWQWVAGTGCDAQPYFRIFNPWLQQKKFDSQCVYIKDWIPELRHLDIKIIHKWYEQHSPKLSKYPSPMVDHAKQSIIAKKMYGDHNS